MSSNSKNNKSPNKILLNNSKTLTSTPRFSSLLSFRSNTNSKLKKISSNSKSSLLSSIKTNFNSNLNNNHSSTFLIPYSRHSISQTTSKKKSNNFIHKITFSSTKYLFTETKEKSNISNLEENKFSNSFLNKKRKLMTSEEIELEKIKGEKDKQKKLMEKNRKLYLKSFNYSPMKIIPSPLTTFKPFKLSSNNNSKFIKQGKSNTFYEVNKQNQKIRLKMQQKIEKLSDNNIKDKILLNNVEYLKKQNILYNDLFNKENYNNDIFLNKDNEKISLNINERSDTPIKESILNFNKKSNLIENKIVGSHIKKSNGKNIIDYLKCFIKNNS